MCVLKSPSCLIALTAPRRQARFVFLSATIPNAREFAEWVSKTHNSPCHVVYTDYRPTPLQHYVFPAGACGLRPDGLSGG